MEEIFSVYIEQDRKMLVVYVKDMAFVNDPYLLIVKTDAWDSLGLKEKLEIRLDLIEFARNESRLWCAAGYIKAAPFNSCWRGKRVVVKKTLFGRDCASSPMVMDEFFNIITKLRGRKLFFELSDLEKFEREKKKEAEKYVAGCRNSEEGRRRLKEKEKWNDCIKHKIEMDEKKNWKPKIEKNRIGFDKYQKEYWTRNTAQ